MLEAVISSVLSAAVTLLVCLINNHYQRIEVEKKHSETIMLIEYKLDELTKKVEKHNQLIERTYELEKRADLADAEFKRVNHRLEDLEKGA